jgi:hypothetical protein
MFKLSKLFEFLERFTTFIRHESEPSIGSAGAKS